MKNEESSAGKLSWTTRIAYGCGDTACNVVWGSVSTILTLFYTDYVGISPVTVGLVMLLSRIFDGVSDVVMGFIVERTNSKWGKSRPWILWSSLPFAISIVLLFTVPQTTETLQFLYMFVTYNFCTTVCYTAINLPYSSLSTMMTRISYEQGMLSIVRMGMSPLGKILAVSFTLPLVHFMGNDQMAWVKTMSIWAAAAFILLIICFIKCEEKVNVRAKLKNAEKIPIKKGIKSLLVNKYFYIALSFWMMQNVISGVSGTMLPYYCKYIFHDDSLFGILFMVETLIMVAITLFICPTLLKKFGKRNMSLAGAVIALVGHLIYCLNPMDYNWVLFSCIIRGIGLAPLNSVIFAFLGDVVEYGQWKTHVRSESLVFAGGSFGAKVGSGISTAIMTYLLQFAGYVSSSSGSAVQPQSAIDMIVDIYMYGPIIVWIIVIAGLFLYKLDKIYPMIMKDLVLREERGEL